MKVLVEHTDTFGGDANYSWVNRRSFEMPDDATDRQVVRRAKAELGLTGVRCYKDDWSDTIRLRLVGMCQVVFITFES